MGGDRNEIAQRLVLVSSILLAFPVVANSEPAKKVLQGGLSDSSCAKASASGGLYTATNADCAKECVAKGRKIVLIDPDHEKVVDISNQDAVKEQR